MGNARVEVILRKYVRGEADDIMVRIFSVMWADSV